MPRIEVDRPLIAVGNSYAVRVSKAEARRLGVRPGQTLHATLEPADGLDLSALHTFRDGAAADHDRIVGEALDAGH